MYVVGGGLNEGSMTTILLCIFQKAKFWFSMTLIY